MLSGFIEFTVQYFTTFFQQTYNCCANYRQTVHVYSLIIQLHIFVVQFEYNFKMSIIKYFLTVGKII